MSGPTACRRLLSLVLAAHLFAPLPARAAEPPAPMLPVAGERLPLRVHVFEDYETEIERRWWLRGVEEKDDTPQSRSASLPNTRAFRAADTKDFDDKQGDPTARYKAVIFNPVPGPPMAGRTRLYFRYQLTGADRLRVQIYSLTNNYHRRHELTGLVQDRWSEAVVDMTQLRRPDGSGGPLSADERIDDIQFYIDPAAELLIDDIVLYEAAPAGEQRPFPRRVIFTGWFDTGKQGDEWPGAFTIAPHQPPRTWKHAQSEALAGDRQWINVGLRGARPLPETLRLRFQYRLEQPSRLTVLVVDGRRQQSLAFEMPEPAVGRWTETELTFANLARALPEATELHFIVNGAENALAIDDVLLYEP